MRYIFLLCTFCCLAACNIDRLTPIDTNVSEFRDCEICPVMINVQAGRFLMGTAVEDRLLDPRTGKPATNDSPQHEVRIDTPFAIGKYEVTVAEFAEFVTSTGYQPESSCMEFSPPESFSFSDAVDWSNPGFEQPDDAPVGCVSYFDARAYTDWLSDTTGQNYRLPSEAEWEYAARAGSTGPYHWGTDNTLACTYANVRSPGAHTISKRQAKADQLGFPCDDGKPLSSSVGSFRPNDLGLYDMQGNAWEWVADCNHKDYHGAPTNGSAWLDAVDTLRGCQFGVIRGGSYLNLVERSSTTVRNGRPQSGRGTNMGFRVARGADVSIDVKSRTAADNAFTDTPGAQLFQANCAACHVDRGTYRGLYGTDLASVERAIRGGGNNVMSMPAFAGVLSADEITQIAHYIREQNGWD